MDIKPYSDSQPEGNAEKRLLDFMATTWKLTNVEDKGQVAKDVMGYFQKRVDLAVDFFIEDHGWKPNFPLRSSCETGDWSKSAIYLSNAVNDLETAQSYVGMLSKNPYTLYQWNGLGYLLYGTPWKEVPAYVKHNLRDNLAPGAVPK